MASFTSLSNELILAIWDFVEVEDVYSFSTISKQVYFLVRKELREHCELMKRLSTISNVAAKPGIFGRTLKEVLVNPRAARYPSLLKISAWQEEWGIAAEHFRATVPKKTLKLFKQAARDNIDVDQEDIERDWFAAIDKGNEEPLIALLLLILPNLREVHLCAFHETHHVCIDTALDIIMNDKHSCSLRKLRSVNLECMETGHNGSLSFDSVETFAAIPSVTSIHGHTVDTYQEDEEDRLYCFDHRIRTTDIVSLTFVNCSIDPTTLAIFLSTTRNLRHFFYSSKERIDDETTNFEPFLIRTALLANARDTLISLIILAGEQERCFMGSLKDFSCLESVQTDLWLFGDPSRLAHSPPAVLPSSIVSITLHIDPFVVKYCKEFIKKLPIMRRTFTTWRRLRSWV